MRLLDHAGLRLSQIDLFAVATGPGSFTGLRVGIATMQGLAFAAGRPLVGVSALDALARLAGSLVPSPGSGAEAADPPDVATWVDAWRGEVYAALYRGGREIEAPTVSRPEPLLARLARRPTCYIGDGAAAHKSLIRSVPLATLAEPLEPLLAGTVARLAFEAARAGKLPPPHAIRPLYIRRPDPEIARDARRAR